MKLNFFIPNIKKIIAIASGKGGVGKSTTSVNLAISISKFSNYKKIGLLDADIYGPSIPMLMNLNGKPEITLEKKFIPLINYGIKCMSMGFLIENDSPMIWRGPMVMNALEQMLYKTDWGDIDILIIDLPPGTGDAQLSICQRTPLTGAIIVCTPQDLALLDAVRGINMFRKVNVPVIGIIENMSYHICSKCGDIEYIFGKDGAKRTAEKMKINFLGEIPLHSKIRETSDFGKPISVIEPNSTHAISYLNISKRVIEIIENENFIKEKPNIVIE